MLSNREEKTQDSYKVVFTISNTSHSFYMSILHCKWILFTHFLGFITIRQNLLICYSICFFRNCVWDLFEPFDFLFAALSQLSLAAYFNVSFHKELTRCHLPLRMPCQYQQMQNIDLLFLAETILTGSELLLIDLKIVFPCEGVTMMSE